MGVSLIALVVLGLFLLFGLGAVVIGILATGSRSRRSDHQPAGAEAGWLAGGALSGPLDDAQRHSQQAGHDRGSHAREAEPTGDVGADSGGFDAGSDGGGSGGGGGDGGGGDGGGGGGD